MRLVLFTLALSFAATSAFACLPDPSRSGCEISGQGAACQFRFLPDGGRDGLTVSLTLRDPFDTPIPDCPVSAGISLVGPHPGGGACGYSPEVFAAFCTCAANPETGVTDEEGVFRFEFVKLGGRGLAEVCVTSHCVGTMEIACKQFAFTSPDLDGSCSSPSAANVIDLGIWVQCFGAPCQAADFDCDCDVDVVDLGLWAGGFGVPCDPGP